MVVTTCGGALVAYVWGWCVVSSTLILYVGYKSLLYVKIIEYIRYI